MSVFPLKGDQSFLDRIENINFRETLSDFRLTLIIKLKLNLRRIYDQHEELDVRNFTIR